MTLDKVAWHNSLIIYYFVIQKARLMYNGLQRTRCKEKETLKIKNKRCKEKKVNVADKKHAANKRVKV